MGDVVPLKCITYLDIPPDTILEANKGAFKNLMLIGDDHDGAFLWVSSIADAATMLVFLELAKRKLMDNFG